MDHRTAASLAEDVAAREDLSPEGSRLAIDGQAGSAFELGQQVEEHEYAAKGGFGGEELFQAEAGGAQIVLPLGDTVFDVGAPVVVPPNGVTARRVSRRIKRSSDN
jgi:hypothetical protein